jgi:antitoxin (DNA-binding transcriptional repressor) of toxin-antitoxin stability system
MIYEFPEATVTIRQGDIFVGLPRVDISLNNVLIVNEKEERIAKWIEIAAKGEPVNIIVSARPVAAIVATQDCDAIRSRDITLCEIRSFRDVELKTKDTSSPKKWKDIITQHARINQKWFYLPPDDTVGFSEKMGVDFMLTLRVPRVELEELRSLRKGRLNPVADEHFRERIGEFFRRYPYDEWYPLDQDELKAYMSEYPGTKPFPWQAAVAANSSAEK